MTNFERIKQMTEDEFAEWLCKQFWEDYRKENGGYDAVKYHTVRNFLFMEYQEEGEAE